MSSLIWIASYPKSGNTWLRALFSHYLLDDDNTPFDLNALVSSNIADSRAQFDEHVGLPSCEMSAEQVRQLTPLFHELLASGLPSQHLIKTHQSFQYTEDGRAFFTAKSTQCVIYLVRNPVDVAISYSSFLDLPADEIVRLMGKPDVTVHKDTDKGYSAIPYLLGDWSAHVRGWRDQKEVPVLIMRYEDMLEDTASAFQIILEFAKFKIDQKRIAKAVADCAFSKLSDKEQQDGFSQIPVVNGKFFRKGIVGDGYNKLNAQQISLIERDHGRIMRDFCYLPTCCDGDKIVEHR